MISCRVGGPPARLAAPPASHNGAPAVHDASVAAGAEVEQRLGAALQAVALQQGEEHAVLQKNEVRAVGDRAAGDDLGRGGRRSRNNRWGGCMASCDSAARGKGGAQRAGVWAQSIKSGRPAAACPSCPGARLACRDCQPAEPPIHCSTSDRTTTCSSASLVVATRMGRRCMGAALPAPRRVARLSLLPTATAEGAMRSSALPTRPFAPTTSGGGRSTGAAAAMQPLCQMDPGSGEETLPCLHCGW